MAAEMWYYTSEGKQMDPVSMKELRRLVGEGTLKPTDMVWKDGMPRWIRASSLKELFPDPTSALDHFFTSTKEAERKVPISASPGTAIATNAAAPATTAPKPSAGPGADASQNKPKPGQTTEPPRRRAEPKPSGGGSIGLILMMLLGAGVLVTCLFGMVIGAVFLVKPPGDNKTKVADDKKDKLPPIDGEVKFELQLGGGQKNKKAFGFKNGVNYEVRVTIQEPADPNARAAVVIYHSSGAREEKASRSNPVKRSYDYQWTPTAAGDYGVEIENKTFGDMKVAITIRDTNAPEGKGDPLPEGVREGRSTFQTDLLKPGKDQVFEFRVKGGHDATFSATCISAKVGSDINIQVLHRTNANVFVEDMGQAANASVRFTRPDTEIVRLRVINASAKNSNRATIVFNVSP